MERLLLSVSLGILLTVNARKACVVKKFGFMLPALSFLLLTDISISDGGGCR